MVDINIIKVGQKTYSVKTKIKAMDDDCLKVIILSVDEVELNSLTSFTKLKNIWTNPTNDSQFDSLKFNDIYQTLIKKMIEKYKMKKIII